MMAGTRDAIDSMPPWDAAAYFDTVREIILNFTVAGTKQICTADPNRVALLMSTGVNNTALAHIAPTVIAGAGIEFNAQVGPVYLLFAEVGPLCQQEWWATVTAAQVVTAYTVGLTRWPHAAIPKGRARRATGQKPK